MRVLNAISLLAAVSAALFASARPATANAAVSVRDLPVPVDKVTGVTGTITNALNGAHALGQRSGVDDASGTVTKTLNTDGVTGAVNNLKGGLGHRSVVPDHDVDEKSLPSLIIGATHEVIAIAARIDLALAVAGEVKVKVIVGLVEEILEVVVRLVAHVKLLIGLEAKAVLFLGARLVTIVELGRLVAILLYVIISTLFLVHFVVGVAVYAVVAHVGVSLGLLLGYVIRIVGRGIIVEIVGFVGVLRPVIKILGFLDVLAVLKL